jgi:NCS1 nucleoside transporter family
MSGKKTDYAIEEYVPMADRHYGFWDMAAVWMGANCHPSSWWVGGVIAAAGLTGAIKINLIANPVAAVIIVLVAFMGFKIGTTTIGLTRVPLGIAGSRIAGFLNVLTSVGWAAVGCFLGAISMSYVLAGIIGTPVYGEPGSFPVMAMGILVNGLLSLGFVTISGSKSIAVAEKILVVGLLVISGWITFAVFSTYSIIDMLAWVPSAEVAIPFGFGMDALIAFMLGWVFSSCEFTRYAKTKSASTWAPALGLTVAAWWFVLVGTFGTIAVAMSTGIFDPNMSDPSTIASGLGLGWAAFVVIIMSTVTTNLISIYVGAYSLMNVFPKLKLKPTILGIGFATVLLGIVTLLSGSFYNAFSVFLGYIGAAFAPLTAILIVDFYLIRKQDYRISLIGNKTGPYWYKTGFNPHAMVTWVAGTAIYLTMSNSGFGSNFLGYVIPSILMTGMLYYIVAKIAVKQGAYTDMTESEEQAVSNG